MPDLLRRREDGLDLPYLVWHLPSRARVASSAVLGGGIGERGWIINAQVRPGYDRLDPDRHLAELAAGAGLIGRIITGADPAADPVEGLVGMLTAADVEAWRSAADGGVRVDATVGVRVPTWAASPPYAVDPELDGPSGPPAAAGDPSPLSVTGPVPGTINLVAFVPVHLTDAALVNLVATATEAKAQALLDAGIPGTGTATDTVCVVGGTPDPAADPDPHPHLHTGADPDTGPEAFGGPRSVWGARLARAVHRAVTDGLGDSLGRMGLAPGRVAGAEWPGGSPIPSPFGAGR